MSLLLSPTFLPRVLLADGLSSALAGIALLLGAGPLSALFGLPSALLLIAGGALLAFGLPVAWLGQRARPGRGAVRAVIAINAVWALDCVLLIASGYLAPTALGQAFVIAQAAVAAIFAELQFIGLRRPLGAAVRA